MWVIVTSGVHAIVPQGFCQSCFLVGCKTGSQTKTTSQSFTEWRFPGGRLNWLFRNRPGDVMDPKKKISVAFQQAKVQRCEGRFCNRRVGFRSTVEKRQGPIRALVVSTRWPRAAPESRGPWRCPAGATAERGIRPRSRRRSGAPWGGWGRWAGTEAVVCGGCDLASNRSGFHPGAPGESGGRS